MDDKNLMEGILLLEKGVCDLYMHGTIESSTDNVHQAFKVFAAGLHIYGADVHPVAFNISLLLFSSFNMRKACCLSLPKMRYKSLIVILLIHNRV